VQSVYRTKENDQKQRMWFVLDNALVLPEYLVEFEYVTNLKPNGSSSGVEISSKKSLQTQDSMGSNQSNTSSQATGVSSAGAGAVPELPLNEECNRLFAAITNAQKVLENTYIRHA
jgi:hypothetical protein